MRHVAHTCQLTRRRRYDALHCLRFIILEDLFPQFNLLIISSFIFSRDPLPRVLQLFLPLFSLRFFFPPSNHRKFEVSLMRLIAPRPSVWGGSWGRGGRACVRVGVRTRAYTHHAPLSFDSSSSYKSFSGSLLTAGARCALMCGPMKTFREKHCSLLPYLLNEG